MPLSPLSDESDVSGSSLCWTRGDAGEGDDPLDKVRAGANRLVDERALVGRVRGRVGCGRGETDGIWKASLVQASALAIHVRICSFSAGVRQRVVRRWATGTGHCQGRSALFVFLANKNASSLMPMSSYPTSTILFLSSSSPLRTWNVPDAVAASSRALTSASRAEVR